MDWVVKIRTLRRKYDWNFLHHCWFGWRRWRPKCALVQLWSTNSHPCTRKGLSSQFSPLPFRRQAGYLTGDEFPINKKKWEHDKFDRILDLRLFCVDISRIELPGVLHSYAQQAIKPNQSASWLFSWQLVGCCMESSIQGHRKRVCIRTIRRKHIYILLWEKSI